MKKAAAGCCYSEFVRKSSDTEMVAIAYGRLAWLEDDPELAARYMELACSGNEPWPASMCRSLAWQTDSYQLGEYYGKLFEARQRAVAERKPT